MSADDRIMTIRVTNQLHARITALEAKVAILEAAIRRRPAEG
jgi:hypothetical protein